MNKFGLSWKKEVGTPSGYKEPNYTDSILHERMMRIGIEYRMYSDGDPDDIAEIARVTLREDFKNFQARISKRITGKVG